MSQTDVADLSQAALAQAAAHVATAHQNARRQWACELGSVGDRLSALCDAVHVLCQKYEMAETVHEDSQLAMLLDQAAASWTEALAQAQREVAAESLKASAAVSESENLRLELDQARESLLVAQQRLDGEEPSRIRLEQDRERAQLLLQELQQERQDLSDRLSLALDEILELDLLHKSALERVNEVSAARDQALAELASTHENELRLMRELGEVVAKPAERDLMGAKADKTAGEVLQAGRQSAQTDDKRDQLARELEKSQCRNAQLERELKDAIGSSHRSLADSLQAQEEMDFLRAQTGKDRAALDQALADKDRIQVELNRLSEELRQANEEIARYRAQSDRRRLEANDGNRGEPPLRLETERGNGSAKRGASQEAHPRRDSIGYYSVTSANIYDNISGTEEPHAEVATRASGARTRNT